MSSIRVSALHTVYSFMYLGEGHVPSRGIKVSFPAIHQQHHIFSEDLKVVINCAVEKNTPSKYECVPSHFRRGHFHQEGFFFFFTLYLQKGNQRDYANNLPT